MRKKARAAAAVALSAVFACGLFAGCQFVTTDTTKDFSQVVAEVDITKSADFAEGGEFHAYADVIGQADILKRDLAASFISNYSSLQNQGITSYASMFDQICKQLVNQQIYIQYAMAYLLKNGDAAGNPYTPEGYKAAVANQDDALAGIKYFLTETEQKQGLYATRVRFNNSLDSTEKDDLGQADSSSSSTPSRTLPTGVNSANADYFDEAYKIYTGFNSASDCGSYKTVDGSSVTSRKKAYSSFLSNLRRNDLLPKGEDTSDVEKLSYFEMELRSQYQSMLLGKLNDLFEKTAEEKITESWIQGQFDTEFNNQKQNYKSNVSSFESSLDSASDTTFLLTAPEENYGYVINILLPFSTAQKATLDSLEQDAGEHTKNKFVQRAGLLKMIVGTDQRDSWITEGTDYSFDATAQSSEITSFYGKDNGRTHLFFKDGLIVDYTPEYFQTANNAKAKNFTDEYTAVPKYYGRYSFNGSVSYDKEKDVYRIVKNKVDIDKFISEMEGYMDYAFGEVFSRSNVTTGDYEFPDTYYTREHTDYYAVKNTSEGKETDYNTVNYQSFMYYTGKVNFSSAYDANKIFLAGSEENLAFSVMNELSFAYNTDTAGLNPYFGYSVVTGKTNYMSEFEYAAQKACERGAGNYIVAPTDYGWHIIYCTFSYKENNGEIKPFNFDFAQVNTTGTFSNLYYEMWKSKFVSDYSSNMSKAATNAYNNDDCVTIYEKRYANFSNMDNA